MRQTATVVIDKDFSEIQAVRNVLPHAVILICKFHVIKAVQEALRVIVQRSAKTSCLYSMVC